MTIELTESQLAELTEEERAGMLEDVDEDVTTESDDDIAGVDSDTTDGGDATDNESEDNAGAETSGDDDHGTGDTGADSDNNDEDDDAELEADEQEEPAASKEERQALFNVDLPEDIDEQINSIDEKKLALADEYDEGLLTYRQCQEQINALSEQQHSLRRLKDTADLQRQHELAQQQQEYDRVCASFVAENNLGSAGEPKFDAFNAYLINFQNNEANQNMPIAEQLNTAYTQWAQAMGIEVPSSKPTAKTKKRNVPTTLANVPASQVEETSDNGRFAALDRMASSDPIGFEEALTKMSSTEREAYLST